MASLDRRALTLRFFIEGAPRAGSTTVLRQLADQSYMTVSRRALGEHHGAIDWLTFATGRFEGNPIRMEVFAAAGRLDRHLRRAIRALVDGIILVVDATPPGIGDAAAHLDELSADLARLDGLLRPELLLLAHKQDLPGAAGFDEVASQLGLAPDVPRAKTSIIHGGAVYAFAIAARACLLRLRQRDEAGLARNAPLELSELVARLTGAVEDAAAAAPVRVPEAAMAPHGTEPEALGQQIPPAPPAVAARLVPSTGGALTVSRAPVTETGPGGSVTHARPWPSPWLPDPPRRLDAGRRSTSRVTPAPPPSDTPSSSAPSASSSAPPASPAGLSPADASAAAPPSSPSDPVAGTPPTAGARAVTGSTPALGPPTLAPARPLGPDLPAPPWRANASENAWVHGPAVEPTTERPPAAPIPAPVTATPQHTVSAPAGRTTRRGALSRLISALRG